MKQKDYLALKLERQNADDWSLMKEDESAITGDDNPEFTGQGSIGRGQGTPSIEKDFYLQKNLYPQTVSPEEIYEAERLVKEQYATMPRQVLAKMEMEELANLREQQEQNPDQPPTARPPPQSPQGMPPQVPGAQSQPLNPFAQPPAKPESGLPYRPKALKHDCLTVHPLKKHEEWEREKRFFRTQAARGARHFQPD